MGKEFKGLLYFDDPDVQCMSVANYVNNRSTLQGVNDSHDLSFFFSSLKDPAYWEVANLVFRLFFHLHNSKKVICETADGHYFHSRPSSSSCCELHTITMIVHPESVCLRPPFSASLIFAASSPKRVEENRNRFVILEMREIKSLKTSLVAMLYKMVGSCWFILENKTWNILNINLIRKGYSPILSRHAAVKVVARQKRHASSVDRRLTAECNTSVMSICRHNPIENKSREKE